MSRASVSADVRRRMAEQARHRCGFCLSAEVIVGALMELDHIIPAALGGTTVEENLWLACSACNDHKHDRVAAPDPETGRRAPLFNPRSQVWAEHFAWTDDGILVRGLTPTGRATVAALKLNRPELVVARHRWVEVGWHPPKD